MPMRCPACGAENPDLAQYCNLCHRSLGFEADEYTAAGRPADGYGTAYPSSFQPGAPQSPADPNSPPPPNALPVDTGQYGYQSGYGAQGPVAPPGATPQYYGQPVDVGQYGAPSGSAPVPGPNMTYDSQGYAGGFYQAPVVVQRAYRFSWGDAVLRCLYVALFAGAMSLGLEMMFSFIGAGYASSGNITLGYIWLLAALLIPCCIAGFYPGYKLEAHGWQLGLLAVGMWALVFRPIYLAILGWLFTERFAFTAIALNKYNLIFTFCLFLPLGALAGFLGEKRATTGLSI